jgi:hypothetical protein
LTRLAVFGFSYACRVAGFLKIANRFLTVLWDASERYFFLNVLEELDSAGEYYIDRTDGKLYFWPPSTITDGACVVYATTNLVILVGVSNVVFSGLTFEGAGMSLFQINGGRSNLVTGCVLKSGSADGAKILFSPQTGLTRSTLTDLGERGVWFYGSGNRSSLTSGSNFVTFNDMSNLSRLCRTDKAAIQVSATYYLTNEDVCGVYIAHNLIHDVPHQAIHFFGNNHLIELNEIHHVCTETADAGAIYSDGDWTFRGNVIRYNYLHDINLGGGATDWTGVVGIYADDGMSGLTVYGNVLCNVDHGILVNGGRDNIIQNNIFVDCTNHGVSMAPYVTLVNQRLLRDSLTNLLITRLSGEPYQTPPWSTSYPALGPILNNSPALALGNVISINISYNNGSFTTWAENANTNATVNNNLTNSDPLFVNYSQRNFGLLTNSPVWPLGFKSILMNRFGPVPGSPSALRTSGSG